MPIEPLHPGSVVGNYRLDALIAGGASSEVYEGTNLVARKRCAVKIFRPHLELDAVHFGRCVHEAKRVGLLGHPNIADTYAFVSTDGHTFSVMERLDGTTLRALVRKQGPLSRRSLLPLVRGVGAGLAAAHALGVVHGHLHGGQVMVNWPGGGGSEPSVKLLDFGVRHLQVAPKEDRPNLERRPEQAVCLAPEQIKGQPADARTDVYALSVMLYEMLTGRVPFLADSFAATLELHLSETPPPPGRLAPISPEVEEMLLRGLEKDPRRRVPSVEALLAVLDPTSVTGQHSIATSGRHAALAPTPSREITITPVPEPADASTPPPVPLAVSLERLKVPRRRTWLFVLLGVVVLGVVATAAWVFLGGDKPPEPQPKKSVQATPPAAPAGGVARPTRERSTRPGRSGLLGHPLRAKLARIEGLGTLQVTTKDDKAQVFVDGYYKGAGRAVTQQLAAGPHRVHIVVRGRKSESKDIELRPGARLTVDF
jgi:serine/threonine-protein kinase